MMKHYLGWVEHKSANISMAALFEGVDAFSGRDARKHDITFPLKIQDQRESKGCISAKHH